MTYGDSTKAFEDIRLVGNSFIEAVSTHLRY